MIVKERKQRGSDAHARGLAAERLAALWLRMKGYRVIARRWRSSAGEVDLIVRRMRRIAFVEVKARGNLQGAAEALSAHQKKRLERAAADFLGRHPSLAALSPRFDVILIVPGRLPRHLPDAWRIGD